MKIKLFIRKKLKYANGESFDPPTLQSTEINFIPKQFSILDNEYVYFSFCLLVFIISYCKLQCLENNLYFIVYETLNQKTQCSRIIC